jgi:hypothetical protein
MSQYSTMFLISEFAWKFAMSTSQPGSMKNKLSKTKWITISRIRTVAKESTLRRLIETRSKKRIQMTEVVVKIKKKFKIAKKKGITNQLAKMEVTRITLIRIELQGKWRCVRAQIS